MRKIIILSVILLLIVSCKQFQIIYDSRNKTDQMRSDELNSKDGPYTLTIAFESSLVNEHVKVEAPSIVNPADWQTYFNNKLIDCEEYSCKIIKVNSAGIVHIYINKKKIVLDNNPEHSLSEHRYLFISKEKGKYIFYFSNYPKAMW
ncbi:hypothetical protein [Flavobacterium sp. NRK1]|uniref:hypothetical protein n=1 Tax=Flavobacterium sp. NRK1 TaxID=2954929 RepID=UPI00209293C4|nr:hypothetical protein [Flavobacterium sp. NRK1]MCO6147936.1 hypothetical protein [Flavobacterium sp. NRK1]